MKGLYLVTPDWDDTQKMLVATEAGLRGGAAVVQYRHKTASPELRREQATQLQVLCRLARRRDQKQNDMDFVLVKGKTFAGKTEE